MALKSAVGYSEDIDSKAAIEEVLKQCAETLDGRTPRAGLLYAGIDHDHQELLNAVLALYPGTRQAVAVFPEAPDAAESGGAPGFYLSTPFDIEPDGGMFFQPTVKTGARIRFADVNREQVLSGVEQSTALAMAAYPDERPEAALIFSCAGRHGHLGTRVSLEHQVMQKSLGPDVPVISFYTYGEICPLPHSTAPQAHGCTFVTVLLGEEK